jgi:TPR repeat protein
MPAGAAIAGPLEDAQAALQRSDYATAKRIIQPLADQGDPNAQYQLGDMYYLYLGAPYDYVEAMKWYRKAADQGHPRAQYRLGDMYLIGRGVPKEDYVEAVRWYRKAAEQGDAHAQYNLGQRYLLGQGVPYNLAEGMRWYYKAAEQGLPPAQLDLGWTYQYEDSVRNYAEAVRWYRKAAGVFPEAQHRLGQMYEEGFGVPQNYVLAYMWYNLAGSQASRREVDFYIDTRNRVARMMTSAQIAEGQKMSVRCLRSNYADCE